MSIRLYDTAQNATVPFGPGPEVSIYVCGITPYDATHLGHAFTYLTFDVLVRRLEDRGHKVRMVRNITDVDDSILAKAEEIDTSYLELANSEIAVFQADVAALDFRPANDEPRATDSIYAMLELIERLVESGHTYSVDGTTFFDTTTFPRFGDMCGYDEAKMIRLAAERGGNPADPRLRNPLDFVLWQGASGGEPSWNSQFGPGRPGWHLECSAMSMAAHGSTVDLHGGGTDLIFPHHECEIAQSEAATNKPFAKHWLHVGMVAYKGTKMSKSLGNLVFVRELRTTYDPRAIRLALMAHHYRSDFEWFDNDIDEGVAHLERLTTACKRTKGPDPNPTLAAVRSAIDSDLDLPAARAALDELARGILEGAGDNTGAVVGLIEAAELLGIRLATPLEQD